MSLLTDEILEIARTAPDSLAVAGRDGRLTYRELADRSLALAAAMESAGLEPGDRVVMVSENSAEYLVATLATWMAGGVFATVYPSYAASELEYVFENSEPRLAFVAPEREAAVAAAMAAAGSACSMHVIGPGGPEGLPEAEPLSAPRAVDPSAPALICYTSGSTARPKPVVHSYEGLAGGALAYAKVLRCDDRDRTLVCVPMAWVYGLISIAMSTLTKGGAVIALPRYNPVDVVAAIQAERITFFPGVTTMYVKLLAYVAELERPPDLRSLRVCISGGEPRNDHVFDQWRELTGCPVHDVYCASECFPVVATDPLLDPEPRPGSAGRVVPEAEMRVVDESGADVPDGEIGEALWRGPAFMLEYWREPELTAAAFTDDGWYRSRDYTRIDEDGYVFVTGRVSDMIIRGGSNVSPAEVEAVLREHPGVADVAVVGLPDPEYGERVAAAIVLKPAGQFDEPGYLRLCEARLAPYKIPSVFRRFDDLPRNVNGKVLRRDLRPALMGDPAAAPEPLV